MKSWHFPKERALSHRLGTMTSSAKLDFTVATERFTLRTLFCSNSEQDDEDDRGGQGERGARGLGRRPGQRQDGGHHRADQEQGHLRMGLGCKLILDGEEWGFYVLHPRLYRSPVTVPHPRYQRNLSHLSHCTLLI